MDKTKNKTLYDIEDFERQCHLWSIVPGGQGKGIILLRKLVDALQADSYSRPGSKLPSILIAGKEGKQLAANALINSLALEDVRKCSAQYLENGISSFQFFSNSTAHTAHVIFDIEHLKSSVESTLWRYLSEGRCGYYNYVTQKCDNIIHCNGLMVMTTANSKSASAPIVKATDHVIELEPLTKEQRQIVLHQYLKFCGIDYEGEQVLRAVAGDVQGNIRQAIQLLKTCLVILRGEHEECLTVAIVEKAKRLTGHSFFGEGKE